MSKHAALLLLTMAIFTVGSFPAAAAELQQQPYTGVDLLETWDGRSDITVTQQESYPQFLENQREALRSKGFQPWSWTNENCGECRLHILPLKTKIEREDVYAFLRALEDHKTEILSLYSVSSQEYNLLAKMAVGILGRESLFFQSPRYRFKEAAPWIIAAAKVVDAYSSYYSRSLRAAWNWDEMTPDERARAEKDRPRLTLNSRGPTQIKNLPAKIVERYGVEPGSLNRPDHAAVATMGYLIEALEELKRRVVRDGLTYLDEARDGDIVDYLPYIYFGSRWQLMLDPNDPKSKPAAEPWRNVYIRDMKTYMTWIELYEAPPQTSSLP